MHFSGRLSSSFHPSILPSFHPSVLRRTLRLPPRYNLLSHRFGVRYLRPAMTVASQTVIRPERTYEIHEVAELTGLAAARLRVWERRYEVVRPRRQPNGYRAYTADQVALLRAFARLIDDGERIGDLAVRPREEVLARAQARALDGTPQAALLDAVAAFDRERLEGLVAQQLALRGLRASATEIVL